MNEEDIVEEVMEDTVDIQEEEVEVEDCEEEGVSVTHEQNQISLTKVVYTCWSLLVSVISHVFLVW